MSGVGYEQLNSPLKARLAAGGGGDSSGGGNFIFVPQFNTVKLNLASNKVNTGLSTFNKDFDILLVFKNSVYMAPNEFYSLISNTEIQATGGQTWTAGTVFQFVAFCVNRAPNALKTISIKNKVEITSNTNFVPIGINDFNPDTDTMLLFENGVYMEKDLDYTVDSTNIYPVRTSSFEASTEFPIIFNIVLLRSVFDGAVLTELEGTNIKDGTITKQKLNTELQNLINEITNTSNKIGNLNALQTGAKDNLVNSINEVKGTTNNINNSVSDINNRIGNLHSLQTGAKDNVVNSINEVKGTTNNLNNSISNLSNSISNINNTIGGAGLQTSDKTIKGAINEVFQSGVNKKQEIINAVNGAGGNISGNAGWGEIINKIPQLGVKFDNISSKIKLYNPNSFRLPRGSNGTFFNSGLNTNVQVSVGDDGRMGFRFPYKIVGFSSSNKSHSSNSSGVTSSSGTGYFTIGNILITSTWRTGKKEYDDCYHTIAVNNDVANANNNGYIAKVPIEDDRNDYHVPGILYVIE